ncbi:glycine--tRNA ligase, partial [Candidatus Gottesmanbacteria bacterium]|nr:glycine--tRNA ligase [Candidatus Gottesmanbacteria bacterium]
FIPYIIEPSVGVSRLMLALLIDAYAQEEKRVVLRLHPRLSPYKVAVFPLVANKPELVAKAQTVHTMLKKTFVTAWDDRGNIGKRYLSQDEAGTQWCVTVDYATLVDDTVTVRDRDTTKQDRVNIGKLVAYIEEKLKEELYA